MVDKFVEKKVIDERFNKLKEIQTEISTERYSRFVGTHQKILIENQSKKDQSVLSGKIDSGQITHIKETGINFGDLVDVKIYDSTPFYLKAKLI